MNAIRIFGFASLGFITAGCTSALYLDRGNYAPKQMANIERCGSDLKIGASYCIHQIDDLDAGQMLTVNLEMLPGPHSVQVGCSQSGLFVKPLASTHLCFFDFDAKEGSSYTIEGHISGMEWSAELRDKGTNEVVATCKNPPSDIYRNFGLVGRSYVPRKIIARYRVIKAPPWLDGAEIELVTTLVKAPDFWGNLIIKDGNPALYIRLQDGFGYLIHQVKGKDKEFKQYGAWADDLRLFFNILNSSPSTVKGYLYKAAHILWKDGYAEGDGGSAEPDFVFEQSSR